VAYAVFDRGDRVRRDVVDLAAGQSVVRVVRWRPHRPAGRHAVLAEVDPRDRVAESDERDNRDRLVVPAT
jgi:subtilase family serine protease